MKVDSWEIEMVLGCLQNFSSRSERSLKESWDCFSNRKENNQKELLYIVEQLALLKSSVKILPLISNK